jgi:hypothetical protein
MNSALDFAIISLATFRITRLITTDVILNKLRERVWKKYPPENGGLGYLITCDWCTSIWVASPLVVSYTIADRSTVLVAAIFAASGIAGLINRVS